ncbi:MAG: NUDIX domain-containing protein [Nanoarchaeota archaeon]
MEKSAGIILFREKNGKREYLLLKYAFKTVFWSFSKGIIEKNETPQETALREAKEETGLRNIEIIPGFEEKTSFFKQVEGKRVYKEVIWFLGKVPDDAEGKVSEEHEELKWFPVQEALKNLKYESELLVKAEKKLNG